MSDDGIPRIVKPRDTSKSPEWLPIIAVDYDSRTFLNERTGEVGSTAELHHHVLASPPSIVVAQNAAEMVAGLDRALGPNPLWQYRAIPHRREVWRPDGDKRRPVVVNTIIGFFGFKNTNKNKKGRWFYPIDPIAFCDTNINMLMEGDAPAIVKLMEWARDVREFCQAQNLRVTPTSGGIAGQLLRDPRFYPDPRRKVPKRTNALARDFLPGNHYKLFVPENQVIKRAVYLDMKSAHHNCAASLRFPHADNIMFRGDWDTTDPTDPTVPFGRPRWEPGTPTFDEFVSRFMGLMRVRLRVPEFPIGSFPLPFMERPGLVSAFVYTNELAYINRLGAKVEGIDAAWGGFKTDDGLNRYAVWAMTETATMTPERKRWAKSTLLSTYGVLAARPRELELCYRRMKGGTDAVLPAGGSILPVKIKTLPASESKTANVLHRGMIEAQTRIECCEMARTMTSLGHRVLSIYADAVVIEAGGPLPLLPAPWEVKAELDGLVYFNATSFHSRQLTRLPGMPRSGKERILRLEAMRQQSSVRSVR